MTPAQQTQMSEKLRVLDLFSGIGGFSLGLERTGGFETVAFCEIEEFPRKVLAKHWPEVPQFHDVRKLKGSDIGAVDVICGGYPCQPFSTAGKRRGEEDDRHLWPEFSRLVAELRPSWVIGENVAGHISMGLDDVLSDLEGQGYAARTFVIPACAVDASHKRERCWIVAKKNDSNANGKRSYKAQQHIKRSGKPNDGQECDVESICGLLARPGNTGFGHPKNVADANRQRRRCGNTKRENAENAWESPFDSRNDRSRVGKWLPEPNVGRVANGVPRRVDRLKALGNAIVPQIPEMIGHAILEAEMLK